MHIIGIAGSLRKGSYNRALLREVQALLPKEHTFEVVEIGSLPLFNEDLEGDLPREVRTFKERIKKADALMIATAEYNYSVPGVLKNALDWGSRPSGDNSWEGKPLAILGASQGPQGSSRAQYHLRQVCVTLNLLPLNKPEFMLGLAQDKFDAAGRLTDPKARERLEKLVGALIAWAKKLL